MTEQQVDFLHDLNQRLVQKPKRKSKLASYFAAHYEFQEEYREPSASPEPQPSSNTYSTTTQPTNTTQARASTNDSSSAFVNILATEDAGEDDSRKSRYKKPNKITKTNSKSTIAYRCFADIL